MGGCPFSNGAFYIERKSIPNVAGVGVYRGISVELSYIPTISNQAMPFETPSIASRLATRTLGLLALILIQGCIFVKPTRIEPPTEIIWSRRLMAGGAGSCGFPTNLTKCGIPPSCSDHPTRRSNEARACARTMHSSRGAGASSLLCGRAQ